jgi:hypothetical protein
MPPKKAQSTAKSAVQEDDDSGAEEKTPSNSDIMSALATFTSKMEHQLISLESSHRELRIEFASLRTSRPIETFSNIPAGAPASEIPLHRDQLPDPQLSAPTISEIPVIHGLKVELNGLQQEKLHAPQNLPMQSEQLFPNQFIAGATMQSGQNGIFGDTPSDPTWQYAQGVYNPRLGPRYEQEISMYSPNVTYTLPPPNPFMGKLVELKDPIEYWRFEEDFNHWKLVNPHHAPHMRLMPFIDKKLLIGTLQLGEFLSMSNAHLLTDMRIRQSITAHFNRSIKTRHQFLDCIERVGFNAAPLPAYLTHPEAELQPLLVYLHKLDSIFHMLSEMTHPDAVPQEEAYDRAQRTTIKYVLNAKISPWLPIWRQEIFDDASKMKGRWPQISAWIQSRVIDIQRRFAVSAPLYAQLTVLGRSKQEPLLRVNPESFRRHDNAPRQDPRTDSKQLFQRPKGLWQPPQAGAPKPIGAPPRSFPRSGVQQSLHYTVDEADEEDPVPEADSHEGTDESADYYTADDDSQAQMHAMAPAPAGPCHAVLTTGTCTKSGCTYSHNPEVIAAHQAKTLAAVRLKPI